MSRGIRKPRRAEAAKDSPPVDPYRRMKAYYDRSITGVGDAVAHPEAGEERYAHLRALSGIPPAKPLVIYRSLLRTSP
jgi:hypothetical protein